MTGAIVNLGKFLSQDFTAGKCANRRAYYPPASFTKVMRVRSMENIRGGIAALAKSAVGPLWLGCQLE